MSINLSGLAGKHVLLTGHSGFKGSWLALRLVQLGARVTGFSLDLPTTPSLFDLAGLNADLDDRRGDIRDADAVRALVAETRPDIIIHLAAEAILKRAWHDPVATLATNIMGTAHLLDAVRSCGLAPAIIIGSSDKAYAPAAAPLAEDAPLGGADPYSMSKAATDMLVHAWRHSYGSDGSALKLASVRAGNVIGGGDWGAERLVPQALAALTKGEPIRLRDPAATRPWQHVLDAVNGYLMLAAGLAGDAASSALAGPWNLGPDEDPDQLTTRHLAERLIHYWGAGQWVIDAPQGPIVPETRFLALDSRKARDGLGWAPAWSMDEAARRSVEWVRGWHSEGAPTKGAHPAIRALCEAQIAAHQCSVA